MAVQKKAKTKAKKTGARKRAPAAKATILQLDKSLDKAAVAELKEKLAETLKSGEPITIDVGSVESVDTAALQLLVEFARHSDEKSSAVSWVNSSDVLIDSARLLDLDSIKEKLMAVQKSKKKVKKAAAKKPAAAAKSASKKASAKAPTQAVAENTTLRLDKDITIQGVAALKEKLAATLTSGEPVKIDAGAVETVDTAALQLLVAFARHSEAQSNAVNWVQTSDAFVDSARLLDLAQHLGLESATA